MKIHGLNEIVHCLDDLQQSDIENSFYVTSDESDTTSILQASKNTKSVEKCQFSGNINDGFELNFNSNEW